MRVEKTMRLLEGMLKGIAIDGIIRPGEVEAINDWCGHNRDVAHREPFKEAIDRVRAAIADGILTDEERSDLLWMCQQATENSRYFSAVTADMQRLHGILGGIAADQLIEERELAGVREWLDGHEQLKTTWPYDEIDSLITRVMADRKIDAQEHKFLADYCAQFIGRTPQTVLEKPEEDLIRWGVCATQPQIMFPQKSFCFTGKSTRAARSSIHQTVSSLGGIPTDAVSQSLHYLIVGDYGNAAWVFSCYGRKVEKAVEYRRKGISLVIVHELDFWDAVQDAGGRIPK